MGNRYPVGRTPHLDLTELLKAVELVRIRRDATWVDICADTGIPRSSLCKFRRRKHCLNAPCLVALADWAGFDPRNFLLDPK